MTVIVRPVASHEVTALYEMRLSALAEDPEAFDQTFDDAVARGQGPVADLVAATFDGSTLVLVADAGGSRLVGMVVVSRSLRPRSYHRARMWGMWVAPEARRHGVGATMLTHAMAWCQGQGVEMVDLWVVSDHDEAIRAYQRAGFTIRGTTPDGMRWQGQPQDEHQMTIHLPREQPR